MRGGGGGGGGPMMNKLHPLGCSVQSGLPGRRWKITQPSAPNQFTGRARERAERKKGHYTRAPARGSQCSETTCPNLLLNRARFQPHHIVCCCGSSPPHITHTHTVFIRKPFVRPSGTAFCIHECFPFRWLFRLLCEHKNFVRRSFFCWKLWMKLFSKNSRLKICLECFDLNLQYRAFRILLKMILVKVFFLLHLVLTMFS